MASAKTVLQSLLLLLFLGLWVVKVPISTKPKHMTSSQWFETQHLQPIPQECSKGMSSVNKYKKHSKDLNTFLQDFVSNVASTCQTSKIACKNDHKNCHQSQGPVTLTLYQPSLERDPDRIGCILHCGL